MLAMSRTPVIYVTAHDDPETRDRAQSAGCIAFFRKTHPGAEGTRRHP
jgi:DNA-binding NarL/FixJ family response regulator